MKKIQLHVKIEGDVFVEVDDDFDEWESSPDELVEVLSKDFGDVLNQI